MPTPTPKPTPPSIDAVAAAPFVIAAVLAVRGAVLAKLWAWFVVPLGVVHLSWPHAMGLSIVASVLVVRNSDTDDTRLTSALMVRRAASSIIVLLVGLAVAAVVAALR